MEDISRINDKIWKIGEQRAKIIAPLAESNVCSRVMVLEAAAKLELSTRYVYSAWIKTPHSCIKWLI